MKIVALDVGSKRIGLAKADSKVRIAIPSGVIEVDGSELSQIASFARVYGTNFFVIGLPRNSKGEETAQSAFVRQFAAALKKKIPEAKIHFQDESLTSVEAEERLDRRKKKYRKGDIDAEAAAIILQDFLENISKSTASITPDARKATPPKKTHFMRNLFLSILAAFILIGVGGFVFYRVSLLPVAANVDCSPENKEQPEQCNFVDFNVNDGDDAKTVANNLQNAGLIRNSLVFEAQYRLFYANKPIQTGVYKLNQAMNVDAILQAFTSGDADNVFSLTIIPGETIAEIKTKLGEQGYTTEEIETAFSATYDHPVLAGKPADASLEGYIFGDTYEFYRGESIENIIKTTLDALYQAINDNNLIAEFEARGMNLYQGITLASLVEQEAKTSDQPTVAQVFYSRLAIGMPLGSDAAAKYAANLVDPNREIYTDNTSILQIDSPYNTRLYAGLPYGPIGNPGLDALNAVAHPSDTSYLYFLTGDDGMMYYSNTDSEHQQNIIDHCKEYCKTLL